MNPFCARCSVFVLLDRHEPCDACKSRGAAGAMPSWALPGTVRAHCSRCTRLVGSIGVQFCSRCRAAVDRAMLAGRRAPSPDEYSDFAPPAEEPSGLRAHMDRRPIWIF